ncbi:unnamed protein product [Brassica rapa subsp. trilocularis]
MEPLAERVILFELLSKAFTQHLSIIMGDAEEVSQHYRLMSRHTRDFFGYFIIVALFLADDVFIHQIQQLNKHTDPNNAL